MDLTVLNQAMAAAGAVSVERDPFFNQTTLILHGDGTNGAQNQSFVDESENVGTITRVGNATQGSFSPFSVAEGEWSNAFDGSGDYFTVPDNAALDLSATSWTIECWFYIPSGVTGIKALITKWATGQRSYYLSVNATTRTIYTSLSNDGGNNIDHTSSTDAWEFDQWNHVAWTFGSSTRTIWVNGVNVGSTDYALAIHSGSSAVSIGAVATTGNMNGYISNLRVVNGRVVYASTFTPPTAPLGSTSGGDDPPQGTETALLTCQSNRFVDNSSNGFTLTPVGNVAVQPFSPFAPSSSYDPLINGGSIYVDGVSGDKIYGTPTSLTGQFTIQCWVYCTGTSLLSNLVPFANWSTGLLLRFGATNGLVEFYTLAGNGSASHQIRVGTWLHCEVTRDASNVIRVFLDGVQKFSYTGAGTISLNNLCIGAEQASTTTNDLFRGYISCFQILNGTCLHTSGFDVPTSPPTNITNTSYLLNFTNAGIYDNTGKNNLETVGNAQVDTSVVKYGTGSMKFDGTGDYLEMANITNTNLGLGPFTIECWVNFTSASGTQYILSNYQNSSIGYGLGLSVNNFAFWATGDAPDITTSVTPTTGTWYHLAVSGQSGSIKLFINGTQQGSTFTGTPALDSTNTLRIGYGQGAAAPQAFNGYIDDLRITKGVARYTSNFTVPDKAFPDQ